jgi:RNA polymerase sigma-70 factor (ECF subfamily)
MAEGAAPLDVDQLVVDHHQALYRYAFRLTGSVADAEDLTQQVFLVAQQKLEQVRDAQCVRGWLFAILRNAYLKTRRQRLPLPAASAELDINTVPDDDVEEAIDGEQLQAAIDSLNDEFKITVLLFYFEHRSYREIAQLLEIPIGTVMSRLSRAKAQLRDRLCRSPQLRSSQPGPSEAATPAFASYQQHRTVKH